MNLEAQLSKRELEVAEVMAFTKSKTDAAQKLFISEGTLSAHTFNIYDKLQINSKSELVIWWFVKKLGVELQSVPYFKLLSVVVISLCTIVDRQVYNRRLMRKEDVNICYKIASR